MDSSAAAAGGRHFIVVAGNGRAWAEAEARASNTHRCSSTRRYPGGIICLMRHVSVAGYTLWLGFSCYAVSNICQLSVTLSRSHLWGTSVGTTIIISSSNNNSNIHRQCTHSHAHTERNTHTYIISFMPECPVAFVVHVVTGLYPSMYACVCLCWCVCVPACVCCSQE